MGEDFMRKQAEQFVRCRNRGFEKLTERHLFSQLPAVISTVVAGKALSDLPSCGEKLWPVVKSDRSISLFSGTEECVSIPAGRAAELIPTVEQGTTVGRVLETDAELRYVRLELTSLDLDHEKKSFNS